MKTGQGFVLAYSITTATSFEAATKLRTQILRIKEDSQDVCSPPSPLLPLSCCVLFFGGNFVTHS